MFINLKNKLHLGEDLFLLIVGCLWVTFNVYFLPFVVWTLGITRPWFILKGLLPYRDFTWIRNPFDLFLLSFFYKIFGVSQQSYQFFVFLLLLLITILMFFLLRSLFRKTYKITFIFYCLLNFALFINTEVGEILVSLLNLIAAALMIIYLKHHQLKWLFMAGLFGGLIYITKQNSSLVILALFLTLALDVFLRRKIDRSIFIKFAILAIGIIIPISFMMMFYLYNKSLGDYFYYTVFFIFNTYLPSSPNFIHGDGLWIVASFISILFPFPIFWKKNRIKPQLVLLFCLLLVFSLPALFPSLLSYRAFPAFGLTMIIAGYNLEFFISDKHKTFNLQKIIILTSFILFIVFNMRFIREYISFVGENNISFGQFITDYGSDEYRIAQWIKNNTSAKDKMTNYGSEIIYYLSNRLPKHKYIEPFPYLLRPYEKTSKIFIKDPPKIVIYDNSLVEYHKGLDVWPFIDFLKKNYKEIGKYGDTLIIYQYNFSK